MNPLARHIRRTAVLSALYDRWHTRQGSALVWPKADQIALMCVAVVLALMLSAYALPESEATIYLRTQIAVWGNLSLLAVVSLSTLGIIAPAAGRLLGKGLAEAVAGYKETKAEIAAGETRPAIEAETPDPEDWTYTGKMSPLLSDMDKLRISRSTKPPLNEQTAAKIKACLVAGFTTAETVRETGLSLDTVKKYAALIRKGFDSPALSVEL